MNTTVVDRPRITDWFALTALVGRVGFSALFLEAGVGKLLAPSATIGYIESAGMPFPVLSLWGAIFVEIVVTLALLAGYKVRWTATTLALFCVATAAIFHANWSDHDQLVQFLKNIAIAGGMLHVALVGGGRYSLDSRRSTG